MNTEEMLEKETTVDLSETEVCGGADVSEGTADAAPAETPSLEEGRGSVDKSSVTDKVYSEKEVRLLLQSEGDRRVSGARRRWEREMVGEIAAAAEIRARELTRELEERELELRESLEETRRLMAYRERELGVIRSLDSRSLPVKLLPVFMAVEEGTEEELMDSLSRVIEEEARSRVRDRLASPAPVLPPKKRLPTEEEYRTLPVATLQKMLR